MGGGARQAGEWRTGRGARAVRPGLWRAYGHRRAEEGDGQPDDAKQQRPGHHAREQAEGSGCDRRRQPAEADRRQAGRIHLRPDLPDRHSRHVALLLAGGERHQPDEGREGDHRATAADGGQHAGRQYGRLLRRRTLEQPRHHRQDRLHRGHHPGHLGRPPGKDPRHDRRVGQQVSEHRAGDDLGHPRSRSLDRRLARQPSQDG